MKTKHYLIKQIITYLLATSIIIFLMITLYQLLFKDLKLTHNINQASMDSSSYIVDTRRSPTHTQCEIIVSEKDDEYIQTLQIHFPKCKIIEKNDLFQFDLINYLSNLFN